jgi:hypothetical protein
MQPSLQSLSTLMHNDSARRIAEEQLWSFLAYFSLSEDYLNLSGRTDATFEEVVQLMTLYYACHESVGTSRIGM